MAQPVATGQTCHKIATGRIDILVIDALDVACCPIIKLCRQFTMAVFEKWPIKIGLICHQSPSKTGFSLATNAL